VTLCVGSRHRMHVCVAVYGLQWLPLYGMPGCCSPNGFKKMLSTFSVPDVARLFQLDASHLLSGEHGAHDIARQGQIMSAHSVVQVLSSVKLVTAVQSTELCLEGPYVSLQQIRLRLLTSQHLHISTQGDLQG
jgi:hypothetical protein